MCGSLLQVATVCVGLYYKWRRCVWVVTTSGDGVCGSLLYVELCSLHPFRGPLLFGTYRHVNTIWCSQLIKSQKGGAHRAGRNGVCVWVLYYKWRRCVWVFTTSGDGVCGSLLYVELCSLHPSRGPLLFGTYRHVSTIWCSQLIKSQKGGAHRAGRNGVCVGSLLLVATVCVGLYFKWRPCVWVFTTSGDGVCGSLLQVATVCVGLYYKWRRCVWVFTICRTLFSASLPMAPPFWDLSTCEYHMVFTTH